jgi:catechol 2,3-dioxygenase-like lactoylglutathione lyase family enzyme
MARTARQMVDRAWVERLNLRMVAMLDIFKKSIVNYPVNPRFRAYGKARIDIAQRATNRDDWDRMWKRTTYPFPFSWGKTWKHCIEYKVKDFAAEVGFFIDFLGFPVNAFDPDYAMFTSPNGEFFFSVVPVQEGEESTPPNAIRLQFMIENIKETASELERRGIVFEQWPAPGSLGSSLLIGTFRSPNGIGIELWGFEQDEVNQNIFDMAIEHSQSEKNSDDLVHLETEEQDEQYDLLEEVEIEQDEADDRNEGHQSEKFSATLFQLDDEEEDDEYDSLEDGQEQDDDTEPDINQSTQSGNTDNIDENDSPVIEYVFDDDL